MPIGKSIRLFLADATVSGIRYAELVNWTGQGIACPRSRLGELSVWPEAAKPGVYFLFESRLGDSKPQVYIGESENVTARLTSHDRQKDFWNEAVIFTSKDENLTKAHIKFLEANLVSLAKQADRYRLENGAMPTESSLPRADRDAMAEFTENVRMVLGTLGYPVLEPLLQGPKPAADMAAVSFQEAQVDQKQSVELVFRVNNLTAKGALTDEGFVIRRGSQVSQVNTDSAAARVVKLKEQLLADGRLIQEGDHLVLTEDVLVSSSSYAAVLVAGTARSGPQSWFTEDGRSLKEIEDAAVEAAS
jgi:hypothetical protein